MKNLISLILFLFISSTILIVSSCEVQEDDTVVIDPDKLEYFLGWTGEDNLDETPASTNFGFSNGNLPSAVDLTPKFPPMGDQGRYGTCVSWAVAYNMKTAINGMKKGLNSSQLASTSNQFSPKDLFTAIPNNKKGENCSGTNFANALEVLQNRGVATVQTVPYTNLGNCSESNTQSSWTNEANQYRIKYWRKVDPSVESIRQNLANNIPILLGAKLADNFMTWNTNNVLSSSTSYNNVGQHAYHAMIISGYDDNKGPNGAFKVVNSWGEFWGDRGYIWVDYSYLINEFCTSPTGAKPLFMAADEEGTVEPPNTNPIPPTIDGVDLAPWVFEDYSTYANGTSQYINERTIDFNLYNIGDASATPNTSWSFYYIYFNAYDADDYGVIFYDEFNTSVAANDYECLGVEPFYPCTFNYEIPSGSDFTTEVWGISSQTRTYYMPQITGSYYLVLVADAEDAFVEDDELNNLYYTTVNPKYFDGGFAYRSSDKATATSPFEFKNELKPTKTNLRKSRHNTVVTPEFPNAYTQEEILSFLKKEKRNGNLKQKINRFVQAEGKAYE